MRECVFTFMAKRACQHSQYIRPLHITPGQTLGAQAGKIQVSNGHILTQDGSLVPVPGEREGD